MKQSAIVLDENPVVNTGRWALGLMKNKLVASVMLLIQGILFIAAPQGKSRGTVQIASVVVILACAVNIALHIRQKRKTALSCALILLNAILLAAAIFCLISPQTVEPYVRIVCGVITLISGLINLIETLKIEKKKNWRFAVGLIAAIVTMALGHHDDFRKRSEDRNDAAEHRRFPDSECADQHLVHPAAEKGQRVRSCCTAPQLK